MWPTLEDFDWCLQATTVAVSKETTTHLKLRDPHLKIKHRRGGRVQKAWITASPSTNKQVTYCNLWIVSYNSVWEGFDHLQKLSEMQPPTCTYDTGIIAHKLRHESKPLKRKSLQKNRELQPGAAGHHIYKCIAFTLSPACTGSNMCKIEQRSVLPYLFNSSLHLLLLC